MKKDLLKLIVISFLFFSGCSGVSLTSSLASNKEERLSLAQRLIQEDWGSFVNFNVVHFSERVSADFTPERASFLKNVEDFFFIVVPTDLSFVVDKVVMNERKMAVTIKWQRKVADRDTGILMLNEGESVVVYIQEKLEWKIFQIHGKSMFTF